MCYNRSNSKALYLQNLRFFLLLMYDFEKKSVFPFFIVHFKVQQLYRPHCQPIACLNHVVRYFVN